MKLDTETVLSENRISQPREHPGKLCVWSDLSVSDLDEINNVWTSSNNVKTILKRIFQIDENEQTTILVDLYYYTLQFAKENNFNTEQTSAFFSMVKQTHEICVETPFDNFDLCFKHFKEQLLCHAVKRPPFSLDLFDGEQIRRISEYVVNTYFRHYKMYKYVFTPTVRLDLSIKYTGLPETPEPSEHGDANQEAEAETETEEKSEIEEVKPEVEEESDAAKQLRQMIKEHLEEEVKKLRLSMEVQLKTTEDNLNQKLNSAEGVKPAKGGKGSAKSKKK